uniref:DNA-directed RNA polymerase subunit n=2 Tax=Aegilops tauschii subsp. strangulata TaxID=200361 RepID=A0A453KKF0_AEGTS
SLPTGAATCPHLRLPPESLPSSLSRPLPLPNARVPPTPEITDAQALLGHRRPEPKLRPPPPLAMEALREATAELTVYVHPSNAADVRLAVSRQLSTLLFSYEDRFDGVLLSHEVEFEGDNEDGQDRKVDGDGKRVIKAKILDGLVPYFGVPVTANMLLFSPQPEMILGRWTYNSSQRRSFDDLISARQLYEIVRIQLW